MDLKQKELIEASCLVKVFKEVVLCRDEQWLLWILQVDQARPHQEVERAYAFNQFQSPIASRDDSLRFIAILATIVRVSGGTPSSKASVNPVEALMQ